MLRFLLTALAALLVSASLAGAMTAAGWYVSGRGAAEGVIAAEDTSSNSMPRPDVTRRPGVGAFTLAAAHHRDAWRALHHGRVYVPCGMLRELGIRCHWRRPLEHLHTPCADRHLADPLPRHHHRHHHHRHLPGNQDEGVGRV